MLDFKEPNIEIAEISEDKRYGRFVVEPLERGYGTTLGNSLRRIMLSSYRVQLSVILRLMALFMNLLQFLELRKM